MRSRSLVQKIKQLGEPTNTKSSQSSTNVLSPEVSTHATNSSAGGSTTLVDFTPRESIPPPNLAQAKDESTEFTQDQPLNLSKKRQNETIRPEDGTFPSNIQSKNKNWEKKLIQKTYSN